MKKIYLIVLVILFIPLQSQAKGSSTENDLEEKEELSAFWKTASDPKKCVVILDPMKNVGIRIADAQTVAEIVTGAYTKRLGLGGITYGALAADARTVKRMLGPSVTTDLQDDKIEYYKQALAASKYRIKVVFKKKRRGKKRHWLKISCKRKEDKWKDAIEVKVFRAKKFRTVKKQLRKSIDDFCPQIKSHMLKRGPESSASEKRRLKKIKEWSPPPMR